MRFKHPGLVAEMARAHPRLQALALYMDQYAASNFGKDLLCTDVERTQEEYNTIYKQTPYLGPRPHLGPPSRAVDFRTVGELDTDQIKKIVEHVNSFWVRQDKKPTAIHHAVGTGAEHLHLQVPPI